MDCDFAARGWDVIGKHIVVRPRKGKFSIWEFRGTSGRLREACRGIEAYSREYRDNSVGLAHVLLGEFSSNMREVVAV